jgi:hypothetical protein
MARYILEEDGSVNDLYKWLKKRPWVANDKVAAYMAGYAEGILAELTTLYWSRMWIHRKPKWFTYDHYKPELERKITEVFFRDRHGFVDTIIIRIPERKLEKKTNEYRRL